MSKNPFLDSTFDKTYKQLSLDSMLNTKSQANQHSANSLYNKVKNSQSKLRTTPTKVVQEANRESKEADDTRPQPKYLTISQLQRILRKTYKNTPELQNIYLTGGITKINKYRWFWYVDLDDPKRKSLSMSLDVPYSVFSKLPFDLKVGDSIDAIGNLSLSKRSQNGLYTKQLMPAGLSQDYLKLVQTKKYLLEHGYFNPDHKKAIPLFPKKIAVVTSQQGAVIRDIIEQTRARDSAIQIVLFPTSLDKPQMIANQIKRADNKDFDTIIVGRGGGSKKDLQPFNDKNLAITVYNCKTPIISSVGHGIDKSLIDYVSDDSVVTPTAAAVDASPNIPKVKQDIQAFIQSMTAITRGTIKDDINQLNDVLSQPTFQRPIHQFLIDRNNKIELLQNNIKQQVINKINNDYQQIQQQYNQLQQHTPLKRLSQAQLNLQSIINDITKNTKDTLQKAQQGVLLQKSQLQLNTPLNKLKIDENVLQPLIINLYQITKQSIQNKEQDLNDTINQLKQLSPQHLMKNGYTYTTYDNHILTSIKQLHPQDKIKIHTIGGIVDATVNKLEQKKG